MASLVVPLAYIHRYINSQQRRRRNSNTVKIYAPINCFRETQRERERERGERERERVRERMIGPVAGGKKIAGITCRQNWGVGLGF